MLTLDFVPPFLDKTTSLSFLISHFSISNRDDLSGQASDRRLPRPVDLSLSEVPGSLKSTSFTVSSVLVCLFDKTRYVLTGFGEVEEHVKKLEEAVGWKKIGPARSCSFVCSLQGGSWSPCSRALMFKPMQHPSLYSTCQEAV
ncbi:PREDICTED: uncharacterized protein LOC104710842 isoform X2 [Camelina sativa]|uniref:Uncharacterized protein LOC104710842 isoform X1 n=1 Tax=Camelina sativa TaxID=90675 RepID=A0ABM0TFV8_CAMSA|nr:PREDICTED: uncharacterized protein LOC104710842 isoform X1 [Camelina sativa]XP_010425803.1 PREDICTED: uncharacterized protein LOC104710842 isoform X2 [Camelina sativa]